MEPERLAAIRELPNYLRAEGIAADLYYREPGGMGPFPPIESITMFIGTSIASGLIGRAAWASLSAAVRWARERLRREPPEDPEVAEEPTVGVMLYGPKGELLKHISVTRDDVDDLFTHPSIKSGQTGEPT
jgi:hypothetical protein